MLAGGGTQQSDANAGEMRSACDQCTRKKIKCDGTRPICQQCQRRRTECQFTRKRKSGPKPKDETHVAKQQHIIAGAGAAGAAAAPWMAVAGLHNQLPMGGKLALPAAAAASNWPPEHAAVAATAAPSPGPEHYAPSLVGQREQALLRTFLSTCNSFLPLASTNTLRDALNPLPPVFLDGETDGDLQRSDARTAVLWGAITLGAVVEGDSNVAAYLQRLQVTMRSCFDCPCQDAASAHLIMATYWGIHGDRIKKTRYLRFASQILSELPEASKDLQASLHFLTVMSSCPLGGTMRLGFTSRDEGDCNMPLPVMPDIEEIIRSESYLPRQRVLYLVVHVVVHIGSVMMAKARKAPEESTRATLERLIDLSKTAAAIVQRTPEWRSNSAELVVKGFLAYVLLVAGQKDEALAAAIAVPAAVQRSPNIIRFPLPWHVAHCTAQLLLYFRRTTEYSTLCDLLRASQGQLAFSASSCLLPQLHSATTSGGDSNGGPTEQEVTDAIRRLPPYAPVRCQDVSCMLAKHIFEAYDNAAGSHHQQQQQSLAPFPPAPALAPVISSSSSASSDSGPFSVGSSASERSSFASVGGGLPAAAPPLPVAVARAPSLVVGAAAAAAAHAGPEKELPPLPPQPLNARQQSFGMPDWLEESDIPTDALALQDWLGLGVPV